jgi:hypothetical protein
MNKVQLAQKALEEAKEQERIEYLKNELDLLKKSFEGRCFGTHTFQRSNKAGHLSAVYYEKIWISEKNNEIYVLEHHITCSHYDSHYKKSSKDIAYNRSVSEKQLTGQNEYNAHYNLNHGSSAFTKEIPLAKFKELWAAGEEAAQIIKDTFSGKFPGLQQEWISTGEHGYEEKIKRCIKDMGIHMVDLKDYPDIHRILEYRTLPLFDKNRWIPSQYIKPIIEWQISELKKDCSSQFTTHRVYEALQREINILSEFLKKF